MTEPLTPEERRRLLAIARETLVVHLGTGATPEFDVPAGPLAIPRGAFVTLRTQGHDLRGCIGLLEAAQPLWSVVRDMAMAAATRDGRFDPVQASDLPSLRIEVSALSEFVPIRPEDVVVGTHGLQVRGRGRSGLLLPQVAVEWGWNAAEFCAQTCHKAGLPESSWRDPDLVWRGFTAEVFGEEP
ncbi:MAG: AmmeMemoRadiSam system protein A [Planctomycetes bacterium]|nr:AmmeMemoRadiSam system protein A [Planctomycetota bacterium]